MDLINILGINSLELSKLPQLRIDQFLIPNKLSDTIGATNSPKHRYRVLWGSASIFKNFHVVGLGELLLHEEISNIAS